MLILRTIIMFIIAIIIMFFGFLFLTISCKMKKYKNKIIFGLVGVVFIIFGFLPCRKIYNKKR